MVKILFGMFDICSMSIEEISSYLACRNMSFDDITVIDADDYDIDHAEYLIKEEMIKWHLAFNKWMAFNKWGEENMR